MGRQSSSITMTMSRTRTSGRKDRRKAKREAKKRGPTQAKKSKENGKPSELDTFLEKLNLAQYANKLKKLGASSKSDLEFVDETLIEQIGFKPIEKAKFLQAIRGKKPKTNKRERPEELDFEEEEEGKALHAEPSKKMKKTKGEKEPLMLSEKTPEELEIEYLERKLGLGRGKDQKNKSRLAKELQEDGFDSSILDFLDVLDSNKSIAEFDRAMSAREKSNPEELDEAFDSDAPVEISYAEPVQTSKEKSDEDQSENSEQDSDEMESDDDESQEQVEQDDVEEDEENEDEESEGEESQDDEDGESDLEEEVKKKVLYMPKEDLYGRVAAKEKENKDGDESSGRKRRGLFANMGEQMRIRKFLNGLVNRLTEGNVEPIANEVVALYRENPKAVMDEQLASIILTALSNDMVVMSPLAASFAALVCAVACLNDTMLGVTILEKAVVKFQQVFTEQLAEEKERRVQGLDGEIVTSKRCSNYAVFICHLFTLGVTTSNLVYDLFDLLVHSMSELSMDVISNIVNECGPKLRKEDPARLVKVIQALQRAEEDVDQHTSTRMKVLMEEVYNLKNNKKKNSAVEDRLKRLNKLVKQLQNTKGTHINSIKLSWEELVHAEERGRWWVVGGVWKAQAETIQRNKEELNDMPRGGGGNPINQALSRADPDLLAAARKQRMNTDVRRAIFVEMMSAEDFLEGFDHIMRLNLNSRQQREIVYVLMRCIGASKTYNVYFEELASHLCSQQPSFKFTFQLAFWDLFKELDSFTHRKLGNSAKLLSHLVLQFALPLTTLKVVDFTQLSENGVFFFNVFFHTFLLYGGEGKDGARRIAKALNRMGGSNDFTLVADGVQFFLRQHLIPTKAADDLSSSSTSKKSRKTFTNELEQINPLLAKRVRIVHRIFDALVVARNAQDDPEMALFGHLM